jgi:DNA repair protein RadD
MKLRPYQQKAVDLLYAYFQHNTGNPVLEAPTAAGKSVIQADFIRGILEQWPLQRILCLCHVKELVSQNCQALRRAYPGGDIGVNAAALGSRDTQQSIIFASIQSVYKRAHELGRFDLIIVDECHLIPVRTSDGMYRRFIDDCRKYNPKIKVIGFSATPYRLDNGLLIDGQQRLFTDIIPAKAAGMSIDDLLAQGYLSPLTTHPVRTHLDTSKVAIRGGEYVLKDLAKAIDVDSTTKSACDEIITLGEDRDAWLIFASSVEHAHHIEEYLRSQFIRARVITGEMDGNARDEAIALYQRREIRALINVNVLTTGFDAPHTDLLAFLRPTMSTSLYVQMAGRGMRIHPGKQDCLVLDFADLIATHGPVNKVTPPRKSKKKEDAQAPVKECRGCLMLVHASVRQCPYCGEEFHFDMAPRISGKASTLDVLAVQGPQRVAPTQMVCSRHEKPGKPASLRVDYYAGLLRVATEWVCLFHGGGAQVRAERWWWTHVPGGILPEDIDEAVAMAEHAKLPMYLLIQKDGKYERIVSRGFEEIAA